jgi:diguanylate cyclase (GGDEF)-like protein
VSGYTLDRVRRGELLFSRGAAVTVSALAIAVLAGWYFDVGVLKALVPGYITMRPNSAVGFLTAGLSLWLLHGQRRAEAQRTLAVVVVGIGAATLFEYVSRRSIGIDEFFFRDPAVVTYPGRMASLTAATFILLGVALAIQGRPRSRGTLPQALALVATLAPTVALVGYLYDVPSLYGAELQGATVIASSASMAVNTAAAALILAFGVLLSRPDDGVMRIFLANTSGGVVARALIPIALLVPVLLGGLFIRDRLDVGDNRSGMALLVIAIGVFFVTVVWYLAFFLHRHERDKAIARDDAETDALTGIRNRRYFDLRLAEEIKRSARFKGCFSLVLFDIDHFKALNDKHGHPAGDAVLRRTAQVVRATLRDIDIFCRYGGEEFALIAPSTCDDRAIELAERVRRALAAERFPGMDTGVTLSAGISQFPEHGATAEKLLEVADAALYAAKERGRNRVVPGHRPEHATDGAPTIGIAEEKVAMSVGGSSHYDA